MAFDWVTFILLQNMGKKQGVKPVSQYRTEREEQDRRNEINRARVEAHLRKVTK